MSEVTNGFRELNRINARLCELRPLVQGLERYPNITPEKKKQLKQEYEALLDERQRIAKSLGVDGID